jgi:hypothetical protein
LVLAGPEEEKVPTDWIYKSYLAGDWREKEELEKMVRCWGRERERERERGKKYRKESLNSMEKR